MTDVHTSSSIRLGYRFSAVPEWVVFHSDLTGEQVRLYAILCRYAHDQQAWPSIESLADRTSRSESSIRRDLRQLEKVGAVRVEERFDDTGRQTSNLYHLAGDEPVGGVTGEQKLWEEGFTDDTHVGVTGDTQTRTTMNENVSPDGETRAPSLMTATVRRETTLFEAFFEFWIGKPYVAKSPMTGAQRGRINQAVKDAIKVGITAEQVRERGERYRRVWPNLERSPQSLLANWERFADDAADPATPAPGEGRVDPSPPRNDPESCNHLAVSSAGWCAACQTQVAYKDRKHGLRWLPGKKPGGPSP